MKILPPVVRYGASDKFAKAPLELAVMVKVFLPVLYDARVIATVSTFGVTVTVVFAVLLPDEFVTVSARFTTVFTPTAGAV